MQHNEAATESVTLMSTRALDAMAFARDITLRLIAGMNARQACTILVPGGPHPLWSIGHLAVSDEWILRMVDPDAPRELPESYRTLFGHATAARDDPDDYPPLNEIIERLHQTRQRLIAATQAATAEAMLRPLGEEGVGFARDPLDAFARIPWHEAWHAGQISLVRRSLNLAPVFPS